MDGRCNEHAPSANGLGPPPDVGGQPFTPERPTLWLNTSAKPPEMAIAMASPNSAAASANLLQLGQTTNAVHALHNLVPLPSALPPVPMVGGFGQLLPHIAHGSQHPAGFFAASNNSCKPAPAGAMPFNTDVSTEWHVHLVRQPDVAWTPSQRRRDPLAGNSQLCVQCPNGRKHSSLFAVRPPARPGHGLGSMVGSAWQRVRGQWRGQWRGSAWAVRLARAPGVG